MKRFKVFNFLFLLPFLAWYLPNFVNATDDYSDLVVSNLGEVRSRLLMVDGNMYFHAGKSKNITFRVSDGASILFGKTDILSLPNSTQIGELQNLINKHIQNVDAWNTMFSTLQTQIYDSKTEATHMVNEIKLIKQNITALIKARKGSGRTNARLRKLLTMVNENIAKVVKMIQTDECQQYPCQNGGTCIDLVSKYQCLCPTHFGGKDCDVRVDECELYGKTHLGCQNNATCTNNGILPGFTCHCPKGFHGRRCQMKATSCDHSLDLCGEHGHCMSASNDAYKCLCEFGYKSDEDPNNPTCVDVDECAEKPCHPGAQCINLPGGFKCSSCPVGLQGNGINCFDIDECREEIANDCSKNPKVQCLNTWGSYHCGPCPAGWEGDGKVCTKSQETCDDNPCHPKATCTQNPDVQCDCEEGYEGDGRGPDGCKRALSDEEKSCDVDGCRHGGTCMRIASDGTSSCICPNGYKGTHCEKYDVCWGNPCGENGKCIEFNGLRKCECNPGYYGITCQHQEDTCGFHTHNETGTIEYSRSTKYVELRDSVCQWTIQLFDTRKIIEFKFENFSIPKLYSLTSKGCRLGFANLTIHDGPTSDRPLIGGFCHGDNNVPDTNVPFYTSGNAAKLIFYLRLLSGATYLKMSWKAVEPRCGGRITQSSGTITYYDVHDDDICAWYISVPPQYHIELTLKSAKMASGAFVNCTVNSLEIFDHQSASNRTRLIEVCENQPKPLIFRTTVPYATVYFKTDRKTMDLDVPVLDCKKDSSNPWCGVGFVLSFKTLELPSGCGGTITPDENGKMEGYIESPGYGHRYFPNLSCEWILNATVENNTLPVAEEARKVQIEFIDFDIATSETKYISTLSQIAHRTILNCGGDFVRVSPKGGMFCNLLPPKGVYSNNYFDIKLTTDSSVGGRGFRIKYQSVCEMDFTAQNGTISSPNYPTASTVPFKCSYRILASPTQAIRVVFRSIGISADINTCFYNAQSQKDSEDYIELKGGHESNEQINRRYVCARYPFVSPHGEIVTSGIQPLSITYSTSGDSDTNTGFSFDYEIFEVGCGGFFYSSGTIKSPNFPERYHPHMYCIYEIVVAWDNRVRLNFDIFDVENVANQEDCGFDNVQVYDGTYIDEDRHGELLGRFCGMSKPPALLSKSNRMSVVFLSDRSVNGAGFSASFRGVEVADDCDQTFTNLEGIIEFNSTLHPRATQCNYIVVLPKMHRIILTFENITIQCSQGSLIARNGMSMDSPAFPGITNLCDIKNSSLPQLITQGNRVYLQFSTTAPESTYFRIKYEQFAAGCGGKVTGISGFISAPQYPLKDSRSLNCDWAISVGEGNHVKLSFSFIDNLDSADTRGDCNAFGANYIDVSDGPYADYNILQRYCRKDVNTKAIISNGNQLSVKYVQHGGSYHGALFGFLAHFDTYCKDIVLAEHHGSIQSPGFPGPIEENTILACKWTILTTPGSRISLQFHRFDMKSSINGFICSNYLLIPSTQVQNITATGVAPTYQNTKFCEFYVPQEIISKNNTLTLEYNLRGSRAENNFWVSWTTLGCGGIILRNNSELIVDKSHFTTDKEERQCQWTIKAPIGFVVKFSFEFAYFSRTPDQKDACADPSKQKKSDFNDGIEFYAGTDNSSGIPQKIICSVINNETWTSQTNEVFAFMRLAPQNIMNKNGVILKGKVEFVKLENDASCGGIIQLDSTTPTIIHSPNYPKAYPKGISCIWEFHAPNGSLVAFNLSEFNNPSGDRRHYYLRNFDGITNLNCSASMAYLEGSLAFYEGSYNASEAYIRSNRMIHRVCLQTDKPRFIITRSQKVVVVFHGSPQELSVPSDDKSQKPNGFVLKAWAKCGGTLTAKRESQSFIIANANDETPNSLRFNCTYRFVKDPEDEDEGDTLYIRGERLPFSDISPRANALDTFTFQCNDEEFENHVDFKQDLALEKEFGECDGTPLLYTEITELSGKYLINYGLESQFCGGIIDQFQKHVKFRINKRKPADCEWQFNAPNGFRVNLHLDLVLLPESELCQESFIEIRQSSENQSEPRICGGEEKIRNYASPQITVRLRYHPNEDMGDEALDKIMGDYTLQMKSKIEVDIFPQSNIIESPPPKVMAQPLMYWLIQAKENNTKIKISFDRLNLSPYATTMLTLTPTQCTTDEENCSPVFVEGYIEDGMEPRIYYFHSKEVKVEWLKVQNVGSFRLKWEEIDEEEYREIIGRNSTESSNNLESFNCGGELFPTYEPQILRSPTNFIGKYYNDQRCKWTINRKRFSNVILKITYLDLEEQSSCQYDYVGIGILDLTATELLSSPAGMLTYCKGNTSVAGIPMDLEYHQSVYIYFVTDRSRTGTGFKIEYKLGCRSFDYITDIGAPLRAEITSPNWPIGYRKNESCFWGVILGSTRQLKVTAELDIDGNDGSCGGDWFLMEEMPSAIIGSTVIGSNKPKRCGQISYEKTLNGRLYAYFTTDNSEKNRKGFKLTLEEVVVDCSSTSLWVDERNPKKILTSPEFPHMSPNSLNCYWIIHTLPGHRVKFTVDPKTFLLQDENHDPENCIDDYLEIRDGPSEASPLIGKYCDVNAPSTIFSTDSSLYIRFITDYDAKSMGFNATYEVASCGGSVVLQQGHSTSVTSPNYPEAYPQVTTCEWNVHAPRGHFVQAEVDHIWMSYSENCTQDYLMLRDQNSTGEILMPPACSKLHASSDGYQSMHDSMFVEFHANTSGTKLTRNSCSNRQCGFDLKMSSSPFECGGEIDDDEGTIVLPGYPERIIPHLSCEWIFKAGMGHRYSLTFSFLNKQNGFYLKSFTDHCYPDLEVFNGPPTVKDSLLATEKRFCENRTAFISMSDLATLTYQDQLRNSLTGFMRQRSVLDDRLSKPWKITYRKINDRFNNEGCSSVISRNVVMKIGNLSLERGSTYGLGARSFCHLQVKRPEGTTGTTVIAFTEMKPRNSIFKNCAQGNRVIVTENDIGPWKINEVVCNISKNSNETVFVFPNSVFDIYVVNNPHKLFIDSPLEFKLGVKFYPCGGTILEDESEDQSGVISSPNFDQNGVYNNNDHCLWFLRASEGKTIEIEFDFMDIEHHYECLNDHLLVAEGEGTNHVIERFCYSSNESLPDRFKKIRTRGRELTLLWKTDSQIQKSGFNLTYSFIHFHSDSDTGCGFSSHAMSGVIESPHYPQDYPTNVQCIWDIVVPFGFYVRLTFEKFDLQLSDKCEKDYVQVSQEHQSRALSPLEDYYFYFEHEETINLTCGSQLPSPIHAESNRIRINFTSDDAIVGKGFKASWKAECGATLSLTHGVITSPHYPKYYPNSDFECNYLIYPALPSGGEPIVVLKLLDFDMSTPSFPWRSITAETYGGKFECIRDYLEIIDVSRKKTVAKYCQENMRSTTSAPPISIKGGIGVRFVGNQSYFEGNEMKRHRGFKISYALADCGGEINLTSESLSATITSPGFPIPYHNNLDCVWNITAPEDRIISAKFTNVEMELNFNQCNFDFVELYDGILTNFSTTPNDTKGLMGRYCGEDTPTDYLITTTPNMTLRFHSDHSSSKGGFKLVLTATLGPKGGCGGSLIATEDVQTLTPPLVDGKYANGLRCLWSIKTKEPKQVISMKFTKMNIENRRRVEDESLTSCYDFVAIYDGPRVMNSFLLQPTCQFPDLPVVFQSSYRNVDFYFESDIADGFDGFNVEYQAVKDECGETLQAPGDFSYESKKGLTRINQEHQRCRFFIYAKEGQPIEIEFTQFDFPSTDPTCPQEFLQIQDVGNPVECTHPACSTKPKVPTNVKFCRRNMPTRFVSQTAVVQITSSVLIQSQYVSSFTISYKLLDQCNRTVKFEPGSHFASGRLTSPNYPNTYDNNATCITSISAPEDYKILIVFKEFRVERGEGFRHRFPGIGGSNSPYWRRGGWSRYSSSPFTNSRYSYSSACTYDSLMVNLNPTNSTSGPTFCGFTLPPTQFSKSNQLDLKFRTDDSMTHGGYDVSYYSVKPKKLSTRTGTNSYDKMFYEFEPNFERSGAITPIGFPSAYPKNTTQRFSIRPPSGLFCTFKFVSFSLTSVADVDNCDASDTLRYKTVIATNDGGDEEHRDSNWISPCIPGDETYEFPKGKGLNYYFEFKSDGDKENDGSGFRIHWDCEDFTEEII